MNILYHLAHYNLSIITKHLVHHAVNTFTKRHHILKHICSTELPLVKHYTHAVTNIITHQIFLLERKWLKRVTWPNITQLKLGNIREYFLIFETAWVAKNIWRIINTIVSIWRENMLGYYICPWTISVPQSSQFSSSLALGEVFHGTDNVRGKILEHIFKAKWRLLCLLSFKYFSQHAWFENWGISLGYSPVLAGVYSVTWRVQTNRVSENIWWIINRNSTLSYYLHERHCKA